MRTKHNRIKPIPASNRTASPDPRVADALCSAGFDHEMTPSGDYALNVELPGSRTHLVIINSRTARVGLREVRCIYACGYSSEDPISANVMTELLTRNADYHVGAWEIVCSDTINMALLSACIAADAPALEVACVAVCIADAAYNLKESTIADQRI